MSLDSREKVEALMKMAEMFIELAEDSEPCCEGHQIDGVNNALSTFVSIVSKMVYANTSQELRDHVDDKDFTEYVGVSIYYTIRDGKVGIKIKQITDDNAEENIKGLTIHEKKKLIKSVMASGVSRSTAEILKVLQKSVAEAEGREWK